ncbi:hypothetical protein LTR94_034524, partial [Friedmanniomyces endolithicus]
MDQREGQVARPPGAQQMQPGGEEQRAADQRHARGGQRPARDHRPEQPGNRYQRRQRDGGHDPDRQVALAHRQYRAIAPRRGGGERGPDAADDRPDDLDK